MHMKRTDACAMSSAAHTPVRGAGGKHPELAAVQPWHPAEETGQATVNPQVDHLLAMSSTSSSSTSSSSEIRRRRQRPPDFGAHARAPLLLRLPQALQVGIFVEHIQHPALRCREMARQEGRQQRQRQQRQRQQRQGMGERGGLSDVEVRALGVGAVQARLEPQGLLQQACHGVPQPPTELLLLTWLY